jgi:hypothetical protein
MLINCFENLTFTNESTRFARSRTVTIDKENFMNCDCGAVQRWLFPCVHICSVINGKKYFDASLFHIRWWKHFNLLFKNVGFQNNSDKNHSSFESLKKSLRLIRQNHFDKTTGQYKGIPLHGHHVLEYLKNTNVETDFQNFDFIKIKALTTMKVNDIPLIKGSLKYKEYMTESSNLINNSNNSFEYNDFNENNDGTEFLDTMGGSSQASYGMSQQRIDMEYENEKIPKEKNLKDGSAYQRLQPIIFDLLKSVKNDEDLEEAIKVNQNLAYKFSARGTKRKIDDCETTFIGQIDKPGHVE